MSRCKACNAKITNNLTTKRLPDGSEEELCRKCISLSYDSHVDREYEHGHVTEDDIYIITEKYLKTL